MSTVLLNSLNVSKSVTNASTQQISGLTALSGAINNSTTTITLTSTAQTVSPSGTILIDNEYITYSGVSGNDLTGCVRGAFLSTAASHSNGASVYGVFVGVGELNPQPNVACSLGCDTSGTLFFQYSNDGTTYGQFPSNGFNVVPSITEFQTGVKLLRYFRIVFKNLSTNKTTTFNSNVYYGSFGQSQLPLNQTISDDYTSTLVRSVITGQNPTNGFDNVRSDGYVFQTTTPLATSGTFTSSIYSTSGYSQIQTELYSNVSGTLTGIWYTESTGTSNPIRTFTRPYNADNGYAYFSSPVFGPYLKYTYQTDASQNDFYLGLKFLTKAISGQIVNLTDFISESMVANLGRNVLVGETDGGQYLNVPVSQEGHLEVAIHNPILPFGSVHTENLNAIFQGQAVYGIDPLLHEMLTLSLTNTNTLGSGTVTASNNMFVCDTGTTAQSLALFFSRQTAQYSPGQGLVVKFTGLYSSGITGTIQFVGMANGQDSFGFGYLGTTFGIFVDTFGVRPVHTLTINTGATSASTVTITLNGVVYTPSITISNATQNAWEIAYARDASGNSIYMGWDAIQIGNTVQFTYALSSSGTTATFNAGTTGSSATFTNTIVGVNPSSTFIPQTSFNGDPLNGTGSSGFTIDPTKGNVFMIGMQYLGFGTITFNVEITSPTNNSTFITAHSLKYPNTLTKPSMSIPAFYFSMSSLNLAQAQSIKTYSASYGTFIEGNKSFYGNKFTHVYSSVAFGTVVDTLYSLYSIRNNVNYNGKINFINIACLNVQLSVKSSNSAIVIIYFVKNPKLLPTSNFSTFSGNSCSLIAKYSPSTTSMGTLSQNQNNIVSSYVLPETGTLNITFEEPIIIYPGEILTIAGYQSAAITNFSFSLNVREDP